MIPSTKQKPTRKYQQVLDLLQQEILTGKHAPGARLPSEAALVQRFGTSRITVGRAVRELRQRGLVDRRAGSGTFVKATQKRGDSSTFGLLIPDLGETEIFEPICQGMAGAPQAREHALLWGNSHAGGSVSKEEGGWRLCQQYVTRAVSGVFFAPFERTETSMEMNHRILAALDAARIPVVLLDRDILPYPQRSRHDLIGIDNRRAGYHITAHLLQACRSRRIAFFAYPATAATVDARIAGYYEALIAAGIPVEDDLVQRLDPSDAKAVGQFMKTHHPDAVVCANDRTAGLLMHTLTALGKEVPRDIGVVGIDDVEYASLLPVPLTTIHQPCRDIGITAMAAMIERVAHPELPTRTILLDTELVVRASCGHVKPGGKDGPPEPAETATP
jgi:GntR family transcriptional regulator of arabinose operon